ncbi:polysaccharide deacetylase family protein [Cellulosilyticum sp. I15G10I2]|uniref:polysaccharide deacetylase family protein n=1 Tax=Cellulosilyticum sp. I15G10I2 TaxID=1892843 RepID=UPI00085C06F1|nr:polysaccharide deacetylase family protein [Cellulosilyticum sp. I15G10I2]
MKIEFLYPQGKTKALTFSYDDGQIFDRKLVEIFNYFGVKGTFHLNSGLLNQDGFVTGEELRKLYSGHEVSCHGVSHKYLRHISNTQFIKEIWDDRISLEQLSGELVLGMSYAFGEYSDEIVQRLQSLGIRYARTVESTQSFAIPGDFMRWRPTCHHNDNILEKAEIFLNPPDYMKCPLFYIWGHSFEFEKDQNWHIIEAFCKKIAFQSDVWYATNLEIEGYLSAVRNLTFNVEETICLNNSAYSVWLKHGDKNIEVKPGKNSL